MSVPARRLATPDRVHRPVGPVPERGPAPARRPAAPRPRKAVAKPKRHNVGFALFAGTVLALVVVGVVALNAFLAQTAFRIDELRARVEALSEEQVVLRMEAAQLSAPRAVAAWARRQGMMVPEHGQVHLLRLGERDRGASGTSSGAAPERAER